MWAERWLAKYQLLLTANALDNYVVEAATYTQRLGVEGKQLL